MTDPVNREALATLLDRLPVDVEDGLATVRAATGSGARTNMPRWLENSSGGHALSDRRSTPWKRIGVAAAALMIALASTLFVVRAFDQPRSVGSNEAPLPSVEPQEVATIRVGPTGGVYAITSGFGSVWVAASDVPGGQGIDRDAIVRLDPATNKVTNTIGVPTVPTWETGGGGLAIGFGSIWIAGSVPLGGGHDEGMLLRLDPESLSMAAEIRLPSYHGATDVATNGSAVWVTGTSGDSSGISKIDPTTNQVVAQTSLRAQTVRHVVATDSAVIAEELEWAHNDGPCAILASVDPTDAHLLAEQPDRGDCSGAGGPFAWDGNVWVSGGDGFERIDPSTALPIPPATAYADEHSFPRGDPAVGTSGVWFGAYPGGNGESRDTLSRFDPVARGIDTYPLKVGWSAATVLDDTIWAMNWEGTVTRIKLATAEPVSPTYTDPSSGWSVTPPSSLVLRPFQAPNDRMGGVSGVTVSNFPTAAVPSGQRLTSLQQFPPTGVLFMLWNNGYGQMGVNTSDDTSLPLSLSDFSRIQPYVGGAEPSPLYRPLVEDGGTFISAVWLGPQASDGDRHAIEETVASVTFPRLDPFGLSPTSAALVLDNASSYAVGSITAITPDMIRAAASESDFGMPLTDRGFYVVHGPDGYYGVPMSAQAPQTQDTCHVSADPTNVTFTCESGAKWDRYVRAVKAPANDDGMHGYWLFVIPITVSWDGHLLANPGNDPRVAAAAWASGASSGG